MELSIVVPAYNEGHRIRSTVETISSFCERELSQWEIIVVDDGSADDTCQVVSGIAGVRLLSNPRNSGKGYSVRRGMLAARLDPVLFTDADLSTPIEEALPFLEAIQGGADIAIASRVPGSNKKVVRTPGRKLMAVVFRSLVKCIALRGFDDTQCGFKMFRQDVASRIFEKQLLHRWGFDVEVLYIARKLGYRVMTLPVSWQESRETRLKATTPLSMTLDLLRVRWNDIRGLYGP